MLLYCLLAIVGFVVIGTTEGKLKKYGHNWNREFQFNNYTLAQYTEDLAWIVGNKTAADGLKFTLSDQKFNIDGSLFGVTLNGSVDFVGGVVSGGGSVTPSHRAFDWGRTGYNNDTSSYARAWVQIPIRLVSLETSFDLKTNLGANDVQGSVESSFQDVVFNVTLNYDFDTTEVDSVKANEVIFNGNVTWNIKPRVTNTYIIQELLNRSNDTKVWYQKDFENWQCTQLLPLVQDAAKNLEFPISRY